jgi:hypothetical protein
MKVTIKIDGKDAEIILTKEQVAQINKKQLNASTCTLQDCIDYLGENDLEVINLKQLQKVDVSEHIIANQSAIVIVKALNEDWTPNWNNSSERKYFIWWNMVDGKFSYDCYDVWESYSHISARLCLKSSKLCEDIGKNGEIVKIFKSFMLIG